MPRPMSPPQLAAIVSQQINCAFFVQCQFVSETIYVWTGVGNIYWGGITWNGLGTLGGISTIEEGSNVQARGISLSLSAIDPAWLGEILSDYQQGLPVKVYLGIFDASGNLVATPITSFAGRMDQPTIEMDGSTATLTIACENRLVDMNTAVDRRLTNEDNQLDHPGDRGFEFVNSIIDTQIYWGRSPSSHNNL